MLRQRTTLLLSSLLALTAFVVAVPRFLSAAPGVGLTSQFEINFLEYTIDHHFSALRMTELAAGTDTTRNAAISPTEGTSPTPGYAATTAKADIADLKSLARRENRTQREEILMAQTLLKQSGTASPMSRMCCPKISRKLTCSKIRVQEEPSMSTS